MTKVKPSATSSPKPQPKPLGVVKTQAVSSKGKGASNPILKVGEKAVKAKPAATPKVGTTKETAAGNKRKPLAVAPASTIVSASAAKPLAKIASSSKVNKPAKVAKSAKVANSLEKTKKIASAVPPNSGVTKEKKLVSGKIVASKAPLEPVKAVSDGPGKAKKEKPQDKPVAIKKNAEPVPPLSNTKPEIVAKIRQAQAEKELRKDLAQTLPKSSLTPITPVPPKVRGKDRLILMVRDPYWLHAHWDITRQTVDRAKASLAENWHTVKPILRLLKMDDSGTTSNAETVAKDIEIHGGVRNWYIEVDNPPSRFRLLMGYLTAGERFYELARSNTVITPVPGGKSATDDHWADIAHDAEHIYAMSGGYGDDTQTGDLTEVFEEQLKRTMDADVLSQFGSGAEGSLKRHKHFHFDVDAELVVFGSTHPEAHVAVGTEPVKVRTDGSFSIRLPLPDRRQVLAATAKSRDGVDEQTVVIAVERNTKVMEPLSLDADDL